MSTLTRLAALSTLAFACMPKPAPHPLIVYVEAPAAAPASEAFEAPAPRAQPAARRALWDAPASAAGLPPESQPTAGQDPAGPRDPWPQEDWRHRSRIVVAHDGTADITGHPDVTERRHLERAVERCERRATRWARERCLEGAE